MSLGVTHCPRAPWDRRCPSPCRGLRRRARRCPCPRLRPRPRPRHRPRRRPRHPHRALCLRRCHPRPRRPRPRGGGTVRLLGGPRDVWSTPFWFVQGGRVDPRHSLASTLTTTHAVRSIASGAGPRSEGRCAPALRRASGPHHLVRVGRPGSTGVRGAEQARSHTFPSPTGGDPAPRRPPPSGAQAWPAPVAPCAHPLARRPRCWWRVSTQSACPIAQPCTAVGRERRRITLGRQRALVVLGLSRRVGVRSGAKAAGGVRRGRPGGGLGGAMCMPRGRGRRPRAVARSQTCEDHTTTPRRRVRARIVFLGGGS